MYVFGIYGFWVPRILVLDYMDFGHPVYVFRDSNVWIRYLGILLYGSGIKGFYCMDFNMSGFGI